jgi:hypothetical protein
MSQNLDCIETISQNKAAETTEQKEAKRKKPKPEEQEGVPQRQHCPPAENLDSYTAKRHMGF